MQKIYLSMPFINKIIVQPEDIDQMGHVNNVVYLRYVQETAEAHWKSIASTELQDQVLWVVLRHEIDYEKAAVEGDVLICATWVEEAKGVKMPRIVEIKNEKEELIAKARTIWCALDGATLRPKRIHQDLFEKFK